MAGVHGNPAIKRFTEFAGSQLKELFEFMPPLASALGLHEYDGRTPDLSAEAIEDRVRHIDRALAELDGIDAGGFDPDTKLDYELLRQGLSSERFRLAELREFSWNPTVVLFIIDVMNYIKRDYAPIEQRVRSLIEYERGIPAVLEQVRRLLEPPLPRPILQVAIQMFSGQVGYLRHNLPATIAASVGNGALVEEFRKANDVAAEAVDGLLGWLKEQVPAAREDFAIGRHLFERMLAVNELVNLPLEQVLQVGLADLENNKRDFIQTARQIDPDRDVREVARMVADDHPTADSLIPDTAAMLEEIRQFVIDRDLVTVPSDVRCKVQETPEFLRWGFAFMDSPGPFEERATEAYYYVTPVEKHWSKEQAEEWLRRFNYPALRDVSIHEAYPGHYVHFLHAMRVMSPVRKVYASYAFTEGWAHYCEQMMVEQGYRGETPLLRFAQLSEALLRNCRYVASILMHTGRMSLQEATRFFMENGFMEELPAHKEALRGTFDPGYLNYTLGKLMILKLRDDMRAREGAAFSLKRFHDRMLALAYPPVPLVRKRLLGEAGEAGGSIL
jgi:uncharacterized protein (DUF885 family)